MKSCLQALLPVCSPVNSRGIESTLCKAPRPNARVLTLKHALTPRQGVLFATVTSCQKEVEVVRPGQNWMDRKLLKKHNLGLLLVVESSRFSDAQRK